jgi:putative Holliday junction resolvase
MGASSFPSAGRLAGIDFGTVRIGIALSDPDQRIASPWETYTRRGEEADANRFRALVRDEGVVGFVVGLPVHMSGDESQKSRETRVFGQWLESVTGCAVSFFDERFTTAEAREIVQLARQKGRRGKELRDQLAAQIILSGFLEAGRRGAPGRLDDGEEE